MKGLGFRVKGLENIQEWKKQMSTNVLLVFLQGVPGPYEASDAVLRCIIP